MHEMRVYAGLRPAVSPSHLLLLLSSSGPQLISVPRLYLLPALFYVLLISSKAITVNGPVQWLGVGVAKGKTNDWNLDTERRSEEEAE